MCEKKEFLQTPFCSFECDVRWCGPARAGGGFFIGRHHPYIDGGEKGRIGGDVDSYVKYAIAAVYGDEEKKFFALATGF
jgi:hypothetical protein